MNCDKCGTSLVKSNSDNFKVMPWALPAGAKGKRNLDLCSCDSCGLISVYSKDTYLGVYLVMLDRWWVNKVRRGDITNPAEARNLFREDKYDTFLTEQRFLKEYDRYKNTPQGPVSKPVHPDQNTLF